jgi:hypothetical protein
MDDAGSRASHDAGRAGLLVLLLVCLSFPVRDALALIASADHTMPPAVVTGAPAGATFDICANSIKSLPLPKVGPNAAVTQTLAGVTTTTGVPECNPNDIKIKFGGLIVGFKQFKPAVGKRGNAKPGATRTDSVTSTSAGVVGFAEHAFTAAAGPTPASVRLTGRGSVPAAVVVGGAAGEAIDPFTLAPGAYPYDPLINEILLQTDDESDFAGVSLFGFDSRFTDPLWIFSVSVVGLISSVGDLLIDFFSQPLLGLDDAMVASEAAAAFAVAGGMATLTNHLLFSTTYTVDRPIVHSVGANAGVERVPEPATVVLLLSVLAVLGLLRRRVD